MLLVALLGCALDNGLTTKDEGNPFDTGDGIGPDDTAPPPDEVCNGLDDDGDGLVDEDYGDLDGDGIADCVDDACDLTTEPAGEVAVLDDCRGRGEWNGAGDVREAVVEWQVPGSLHYTTPVVVSLTDDDGDGDVDSDPPDGDIPDILAVDWVYGDLVRYAGDGSGSTILRTGRLEYQGVAAADVDGDGVVNLVTVGDEGVCARAPDATALWCVPGTRRLFLGGPTVTDLDGDGDVEIVAPPYVVDGATGAILATDVCLLGDMAPITGDLDGDGVQEIVCGADVFRADGTPYWSGERADFWQSALVDVEPDGVPEVLVVGWGQGLRIYAADGTLLSSTGDGGAYGGACVADFDGDGQAEIATPGPDQIEVYSLTLALEWAAPTDDDSGVASCSAFDFDADGDYEIVYAEESSLWILDGRTGTALYRWADHRSGTMGEYPTVADVDGDGSAEIVVAESLSASGIAVIGSPTDDWAPAGPMWPQYTFDGAIIDDAGRVDATPLPPWRDGGWSHARPPGWYDPDTGEWGYAPPAPELAVAIVDVCAADCEDGPIEVAVAVSNVGGIDTTAEVVLYAEGGTGATEVGRATVAVAAGTRAEALVFTVAVADLGERGWTATVQRADHHPDCDAEDDADSLLEPACPV